jgi:hypothetical protein
VIGVHFPLPAFPVVADLGGKGAKGWTKG